MINILYVSNKNEIFLKGYLESLDYKIYNINILDLKNGVYIDINNSQTKKIFNTNWIQNRGIKYLQRYICALFFLVRYSTKRYDICHILNIKRENFWIIPFLKKRSKKIIITVFGRSTYTYFSKRVLFSLVYKYVDLLAFSNQSLIDDFLSVNKKFNKSKTVRIIPPILNISKMERNLYYDNLDNFINKYSIQKDLIRISCSSTIASYDQHDKIIDSISKIKNKSKIQLLFLLTYGGTDIQKERIIKKIKTDLYEFNVQIFDTFLSKNELSAYRAVTDIYINMRTSDQLAGAIIESLFEGALLISGKWLNYGTFDDIGIYYKKVKDFKELTLCIDESIENFTAFKNNYRIQNKEKISKEFSIETVMKKWNAIYKK